MPKPTPFVDPAVYGKPALKSMAESILFILGGPSGAAQKLSHNHFLTLCVCAAFIIDEEEADNA